MSIAYKSFDDMTLAELRGERNFWDHIIAKAPEGEAGIQAALDCRLACDAMIMRRERQSAGFLLGGCRVRKVELRHGG